MRFAYSAYYCLYWKHFSFLKIDVMTVPGGGEVCLFCLLLPSFEALFLSFFSNRFVMAVLGGSVRVGPSVGEGGGERGRDAEDKAHGPTDVFAGGIML